LGSGATVAQLTLDQKVEGSNPSSPATTTPWNGRFVFGLMRLTA
jgi:hypothetical protein